MPPILEMTIHHRGLDGKIRLPLCWININEREEMFESASTVSMFNSSDEQLNLYVKLGGFSFVASSEDCREQTLMHHRGSREKAAEAKLSF